MYGKCNKKLDTSITYVLKNVNKSLNKIRGVFYYLVFFV